MQRLTPCLYFATIIIMINNKNILISVVIPTYNHASFLQRAVASVLGQTYKNWEIIIVDNDSIDNTDEVIASFNDERIFVHKINNNGVVAASRNAGIRAARGEYIAFLDSDDWWSERKLEICSKQIKMEYDVIYHRLWFVTDETKKNHKILPSRKLKAPIFYDLLYKGNTLPNSSVLVKKQLLFEVGLLDEGRELIASEDYDLWLKLANVTNKFIEIDEPLGFYWYGGQNLSKNHNLAASGAIILKKYLNSLSPLEYSKAEGFLNYSSGLHQTRAKNLTKARKHFIEAILKGTWSIKAKAVFRLLNSFV